MLEVLQFVFSGFWTWLGSLLLLACVAHCLAGICLFTIRIQTGGWNWENGEKPETRPAPKAEGRP